MVDFVASRPWYVRHAAPIWRALPEQERGVIWAADPDHAEEVRKACRAQRVPCSVRKPHGPGPIVGMNYNDAKFALSLLPKRPVVLSGHGCGQTYEDARHVGSRPGHGLDRRVALELVTGPGSRGGRCPVAYVGCPWLDEWLQKWPGKKERSDPPRVAISFHWNCVASPEAHGTFTYYWEALARLKEQVPGLVGHGHPRILAKIRGVYASLGIPVVSRWESVMRSADLYVCDNSSTLFEFAASDRPVVVLNAPWYRRNVDHGLRFWEAATVGVNCDRPEDLAGAIGEALTDSPGQRELRRRAVQLVCGELDGRAAERAAQAILSVG